ncbi:MAG: penicillin-binding protein activator [Myxococcota bacterium]|nr:penicillin-binding protein activator [Myxococcota bacterium]
MSLPNIVFLSFLSLNICSASPQSNPQVETEAQLIDTIKKTDDQSEQAEAQLKLGERYRLQNRLLEALQLFEDTAKNFPNQQTKSAAIVGITLVNSEQNISNNTIATLELYMDNEQVLRSQKADLFRILSINAKSKNDLESAQYYANKAWDNSTPETQARLRKELGVRKSTEIAEEVIDESNLEPIRKAMQDRRFAQARKLIENVNREDLSEKELLYLDSAEKRALNNDPFSRGKIGVLLPLTDEKYQPAAEEFQQSINFSNSQLTEPFEIVYFDTKGSEESAVEGVEKLVLEEGCSLLIGPLLKTTVQPAAQTAQAYEIPMLTLSKSTAPLDEGDFIFYVNISPKIQLEALIRHSIVDRGWKKFAALAPDTPHGHKIVEEFSAEVQRLNAEFVRSQFYDPKAPHFIDAARVFAQKDDPELSEEDREETPPLVDFDALFIPDNYRRSPLVASALAYEGYSIGHFDSGHEIPKVHLIGLKSWNDPRILNAGGQYILNSIFVDAIWMNTEAENFLGFKEKFKETLQRTPKIFDAIIFDTLHFAEKGSQADSRNEIQSNFLSLRLASSLTGGIQFSENREIDRQLILLELKKSGIKPWVAPEK